MTGGHVWLGGHAWPGGAWLGACTAKGFKWGGGMCGEGSHPW